MATSWGPHEDILVYYAGQSELQPPKPYKLQKMTYQHVAGGVFIVTLNDPKRLNPITLNTAQELLLIAAHVARDDRCKVVVWTGAGRAFCSGGDFSSSDASEPVPEEIWQGYVHAGLALPGLDVSLAGFTRIMIKLPKISIAAVNGLAFGGGVNLAFVMQDFVYVADDAKFKYPFAELGLTPEVGSSFLLPKMIGLPRAKELLQLGGEFSAQKALELGLCNGVAPLVEVLPMALGVAQQLASKPQFALRESKRLVNQEMVQAIDSVTIDENETLQKSFADEETVQKMMEFAKRHGKKDKSKASKL